MLNIVVSACLLGNNCRYDAKTKTNEAVLALRKIKGVRLIPVCPEVQGGLPTPRPPSEIVQNAEGQRHVVNREDIDVTAAFQRGSEHALETAQKAGAQLAILKAKSPSCASGVLYDGTFSGTLVEGWGTAAELFAQHKITVIDETKVPDLLCMLQAYEHQEKAKELPPITLKKIAGHFCTITKHKIEVARLCFKVGLVWQGIVHDLSKYSPTEFLTGARFYQGYRSPNAAEREFFGYTQAWLHHKGRNKHHFEYWLDLSDDPGMRLKPAPMPTRYVLEMLCDRIAASKTYKKEAYCDSDPLAYYERGKTVIVMHPKTRALLEKLLTTLAKEGEAACIKQAQELLETSKRHDVTFEGVPLEDMLTQRETDRQDSARFERQ